MSGKRVLALYAAILFSFAVILCRLYFLAQNQTYASRAKEQSAVRLALPARRGNFYDHTGALLTGLETQYLALCFPGENSYSRLYAPIPMRTERRFCTRIGIVPCHFC